DGDHSRVDAALSTRVTITAGPHELGTTFLTQPSSLFETRRQPYHAHFNIHRPPRRPPAVPHASIVGPYSATGPGHSASRERILVCKPASPAEYDSSARRVLSTLMRRAFRRPVVENDLDRPMQFFADAQRDGGFDAGIEAALSAILV